MSWLSNLMDNISPDAIRNLLDNIMDPISGSDEFDRGEEFLTGMQSEYTSAKAKMDELFKNAPQIDLSSYMKDLGGYEQSLVDSALRSAGDVEGFSQKGLDSALKNYQSSLSMYKNLAREGMPGMDVYKGQIGSQTSQGIQQLKDIGGLTSSGVLGLLGNQSEQQRNLAIQSSMYRSQRQDMLAQAYANTGQLEQGAYANRANASAVASGLRSNAYSGAAGIAGMRSGMAQSEFQFNQLLPWQTQANYYSNQVSQNNPYMAGMGWYGQQGAYEGARGESLMNGIMG